MTERSEPTALTELGSKPLLDELRRLHRSIRAKQARREYDSKTNPYPAAYPMAVAYSECACHLREIIEQYTSNVTVHQPMEGALRRGFQRYGATACSGFFHYPVGAHCPDLTSRRAEP